MRGPIETQVRNAGISAPEDLVQPLDHAWNRLGEPGTWYGGQDRLAIARETRHAANCSFCRQCKASVSPYSPQGEHESTTRLPAVVIDVIHRVVTDPSRLTETWFRQVLDKGM